MDNQKTKPKRVPVEPITGPMPKAKHIEVDTAACGGCLTCELACSTRHFDGE